MNPGAHITRIPALADFRAGLCNFIEYGQDALIILDLAVRRMMDWLKDQVDEWKAEIRAAEDAVVEAKNELTRRRMMHMGDRPLDTSEQEMALARAKQRLEHAHEKLKVTKHWLIMLPEEIREYEGPSRQLKEACEADVPRMIRLLERHITTLEAYTQVEVPKPPV